MYEVSIFSFQLRFLFLFLFLFELPTLLFVS